MKISQRQLYFFLACVAPVGKLILLPAQLALYSGNDLVFPALVNLLLQAAVIYAVLYLHRSGKTLYELLKERTGKIFAKAAIVVFTLFLLYCALIPLNEQKLMVQSVFYDTLPSVVTFAPFFLFAAYLCAKPLVNLGRVWDILAPLSIFCFAGIIVFALGIADFSALKPIGASGGKGFFDGTMYTMSWFFDSVLVLSLTGKTEYKKGMEWKGLLCYLAGAVAVLFFLATFYAVFQDLSLSRLFAFSKISKYFAGISVLGRIDYLFIYGLALVMAFYVAMPVHAACDLLGDAFGAKKYVLPSLSTAFNLILFLLLYFLNFLFDTFKNFISVQAFYLFPIFTIAVPLLCLALMPRRKRHG